MKHKLIINADDFGITKGVNKAIIELAAKSIITSTSVLSNMPYYGDMLSLPSKTGIGIHFNLTTGYSTVDSKRIPSLVNEDGKFYELPKLLKKMWLGRLSTNEVKLELKTQVCKVLEKGVRPDHIDSHESIIKYPFFMKIIKSISNEFDIKAVRTYSSRRINIIELLNLRKVIVMLMLFQQKRRWKNDGFLVADMYDSLIKKNINFQSAMEHLKEIFFDLNKGTIELGVHPGYIDKNTRYLDNYVHEREIELQVLSSYEFDELIERNSVELISFKDISA